MNSSKLILVGLTLIVLGATIITTVLAQDETPLPSDDFAGEIVDLTVEAAEGTAITVESFIDRLLTTPQSNLMRVVLILGGLVLLIAGWRIYDFIVVVAGFIIGASIGISLFPTDNNLLMLAALLVGGLIGAILSIFLYYVAVFVIGAYIGIVLTNALAMGLDLTPVTGLALLVGGLIGGLLLIGLSFEFLVLLSALVGAQMLSLGLGLDFIWTVIFAVIGVIIQLGMVRAFNYDFRRRRRAYLWHRATS